LKGRHIQAISYPPGVMPKAEHPFECRQLAIDRRVGRGGIADKRVKPAGVPGTLDADGHWPGQGRIELFDRDPSLT
jgi:hypothetical protein